MCGGYSVQNRSFATLRWNEAGEAASPTGAWKLVPDDDDAMVMVARDGIEPPTPAFSGLRSTN